jgi:hypothetical protein
MLAGEVVFVLELDAVGFRQIQHGTRYDNAIDGLPSVRPRLFKNLPRQENQEEQAHPQKEGQKDGPNESARNRWL